ncbi:MAG: DNA polymerase [Candidatus Bathyarchaeota archaeon]
MDLELLNKLGKKAFVQSLKPYKGRINQSVAIFGLDTEYVPHEGGASELICWQLASDDTAALISNKNLTIKNLFQEAKQLIHLESRGIYIFVCYFSLAEIQFFDLSEWIVNEFKGKYRLTQSYGDGQIQVVDLANWYPKEKLSSVAEQWGEVKEDFPIGDAVEQIERGEATKQQLLSDPKFREYALHDAIITQRIYTKMRSYFLDKFEVDIIATMTPANTSASIFRKSLSKTIDQRDTVLRTEALKCCWGGRMECIFRGEQPDVHEYDATGHHPNSAIALGCLPTGLDWKLTTNLKVWLSGISGFGHVYFRFPPETKYPCLPIYDGHSLLYVLEGTSHCSVSEVREALAMGASIVLYRGYFYEKGTNVLAKHLERLQVIRDASNMESERKMLKLQSNSIIGKLFQKSVGLDIAKVQAYAEEHGIPVEEAIKIENVDFGGGEVKVGSCFYPEWYSLILGKARATVSKQALKHQVLVISSDSFVTFEDLGVGYREDGIYWGLKESGHLVSYRTRFYRVGTKLAHHAVHSTKGLKGEDARKEGSASEDVLDHFRDTEELYHYGYFRFLHLKEAWRDKKPFGSRVWRPMSVRLGFDHKRRLLSDGNTVPWKSVNEMQKFLAGEIK